MRISKTGTEERVTYYHVYNHEIKLRVEARELSPEEIKKRRESIKELLEFLKEKVENVEMGIEKFSCALGEELKEAVYKIWEWTTDIWVGRDIETPGDVGVISEKIISKQVGDIAISLASIAKSCHYEHYDPLEVCHEDRVIPVVRHFLKMYEEFLEKCKEQGIELLD